MRKITTKIFCGVILALAFCTFMFNNNALAAADYESVMDKWMITQYRACLYDMNAFNTNVSSVDFGRRLLNESIVNSVIKADSTAMHLPSYNLAGSDSLNCRGVASNAGLSVGSGVWDGYDPGIGQTRWSDGGPDSISRKETFMTNVLKYTGIGDSGTTEFKVQANRRSEWEVCGRFTFFSIGGGDEHCFNVGSARKDGVETPIVTLSNGRLSYSNWRNLFGNLEFNVSDNKIMVSLNENAVLFGGACSYIKDFLKRRGISGLPEEICAQSFVDIELSNPHSAEVSFNPETESASDLFDRLKSALNLKTWDLKARKDFNVGSAPSRGAGLNVSIRNKQTYEFGIGDLQIIDSGTFTSYTANISERADSMAALSKDKFTTDSSMLFDNTDRYNLFYYYLRKIANGVGSSIVCNVSDTGGLTKVKLYNSGSFRDCYVNLSSINPSEKIVYTQINDGGVPKIGETSLSIIISWFNAVDSSSINTSRIDEVVDPPTPTPSDPVEADFDCDKIIKENEGKVGAMQWILCPSLNNVAYTANWIDTLTQDMLQVKTNIYDTDSDTFKGWGLVRDIANVVMVVFLIIIIVSQVTGYGIDNYGIKKMLPRLITMAILINLSFYICELAIDLSNIAGVGFRDMFGAFGGAIDEGTAGEGTSYVTGGLVGLFTAFSAAGGPAVAAGAAAASLGWVAILIAALLFVLIIIVALAILWLMLGLRQIIVIACVILSPLAFAAFILPNTQNLFKKWWELFKAAIIVFPICGAVSGISYMIRGVGGAEFKKAVGDIGGTVDVASSVILFILPYLVFFLLPMLLKNALSALGKLGGALTSMGQTIRNGGKAIGQAGVKGVQNSQRYKDWSSDRVRRVQANNSQRTIDRLEALKKRREASGGQLTEQETRQLARAHEVQRKLANENTAARTILTEKEFAGQSLASLVRSWDEAFDNGETERMDALTNVITSKYGPGGVNEIASRLATKEIFDASGEFVGGDNGPMSKSFGALQSNMMQNSALSNYMQNKASDAYQMISGGGYDDEGRTRHNMSYHSQNNGIATQNKDWATQSSATLRRAAASGALTAETARSILNSADPTIQSGIKSDKSKREVLEAVASGRLATAKDSDSPYATQAAAMQWDNRTINPATNNTYIKDAAAQYRLDQEIADVYDQAWAENQEFDTRKAEQEQAQRQEEAQRIEQERKQRQEEAQRIEQERKDYEQTWNTLLDQRDRQEQTELLRQIAKNQQNNKNDDNNSGQGFSDGGGI